jgi:hypothetical protein
VTVAQSSWPDPAASHLVTDQQYERMVAPQYVDGIQGDPTDAPLISADGSGMHVFLASSRYGQVRGHGWTSGSTTVTLNITSNSSGLTRVDLVVLGYSRSTYEVTAYVKTGTPGSGAPALQVDAGDSGVYEIPLAEVTVVNGAASITSDKIKTRHWYVRPDGAASAGTDTRPVNVALGYLTSEAGDKFAWNGTRWVNLTSPPTAAQSSQALLYGGGAGSTGLDGTGAWRQFTSAGWPPLTFTVPPSGRCYITITGWIENRNTADSYIWISYQASGGGFTTGIDPDLMNLRGLGTYSGRLVASKRRYFTSLTPGASVTLTPMYSAYSVSASINFSNVQNGQLLMEPAP